MKAPLPINEEARVQTLYGYRVLDTEEESPYNDIVRLAANVCGTPVALVSLIDRERQWFKARVGTALAETPRDVAFCSHAILQDSLFVIPNTLEDERFAKNPLVLEEPQIRFYAGAPLISPEGYTLGTLCVLDRLSRDLNAAQTDALMILSRQVMMLLNMRRDLSILTRALAERKQVLKELSARLHQHGTSQ